MPRTWRAMAPGPAARRGPRSAALPPRRRLPSATDGQDQARAGGPLHPHGQLGDRAGLADGLALRTGAVPGPLAVGAPETLEVRAPPHLAQARGRHVGATTHQRAAIDLEGEALAAGHGVAAVPG